MELIYRGIKYRSEKSEFHDFDDRQKLLIICKKKAVKTTASNKFPLIKYCRQLFSKQQKTLSPSQFWHRHQCDLLEICWQINLVENLALCWQITVIIKLEQSFKRNSPTKLKYRGVTYYK